MSTDQMAIPQYRPAGSLDPASALTPYAGPWTPKLAAHLLRRAGFGGSSTEIDAAARAGMNAAVDRLINFGSDPLPQAPQLDLTYDKDAGAMQRRKAIVGMQLWFLNRLLLSPNPLQERMVYFW